MNYEFKIYDDGVNGDQELTVRTTNENQFIICINDSEAIFSDAENSLIRLGYALIELGLSFKNNQ